MDRRDAVSGTAGVLLTAVSAAAVLLPGLVRRVGPVDAFLGAVSGVGPALLLTAAAAVAGLYLAVVARSPVDGSTRPPRSVVERRFDRAAFYPPEEVTADRRQVTAAGLDADVETAVESGGEALSSLRDHLSRTARDVYADHAGADRGHAREAVAGGTWTDDRTAAAFLAGDRGPSPGLVARLRLWLAPETERRRRVDRTLTAIEGLAEARR
jgi:hypothetical protein